MTPITSLTLVYSTVYSRRRSKKASKFRVTGLCAGNSPGTGEFPTQMASNAENVSIWWRHHEVGITKMWCKSAHLCEMYVCHYNPKPSIWITIVFVPLIWTFHGKEMEWYKKYLVQINIVYFILFCAPLLDYRMIVQSCHCVTCTKYNTYAKYRWDFCC